MTRTFISYRHTDAAQIERVRGFAVRLRNSGVEIIFDEFYLEQNPAGPPEGWPQWCSDQVEQAERVLIIGNEAWFRCFTGKEKPGTGRGVASEAGDLRMRLYNSNNHNEHIRIAVFDPVDAAQMPLKLQPYHLFEVERDFSAIVKWLGGTLPQEPERPGVRGPSPGLLASSFPAPPELPSTTTTTTTTTTARPGQWTAMISSTTLDLPLHRQAVIDACLDADIFPKAMEDLSAQDANGVTVSLAMIDQADLYIGIYAWRYGWVPEGRSVSITEIEFDHAAARKAGGGMKDLLIFTAHDEHPITFKDVETCKFAQAKLEAFKSRAEAGRLRKKFRSVEELARHVVDALHRFKARHPHPQAAAAPAAEVAIPASAPRRNELPSLSSFFGRDAELQRIREALDPQSRTWGVLIDGPGGIGKTSLAIRAAHACPPGLFERSVFLSIKGQELDDDGVRRIRGGLIIPSLLEMSNELARDLGRADITQAPESERMRLLLDALHGQKLLLVLDNLESLTLEERDDVFSFVKRLPQGCKAILTSRRRVGSSADTIILGKLDEDAALAMLSEIAKGNPLLARISRKERLELYQEAGGKPLLLRWTAGQFGLGHCRTLETALKLLRSCEKDNDALGFIFADLAQEFTPPEENILCALVYFTQPVAVKHIAELAGLKEEVAELALDSLANRSLVMPDHEEVRYLLVPMVEPFLRQHRPELVKETGGRLEEQAYAKIVENGYKNFDRFMLLEDEWESLAAALPLFLAGPNERLQVVCAAIYRFLNFTGRWDELLALQQKAEAKALAAGDEEKAGWRAYQAGFVHDLRGQADEVLACAKRVAEHWEKAGVGARERAFAIRLRGIGHRLKGDYPAAIAACEQVLELWRGIAAESEDVAMGLNALANAERHSGKLDAAEGHYREALEMARATGYAEIEAISTGNLADMALTRGDWPAAEDWAREALALSEKVGRRDLVAEDNRRLAESLLHQGRTEEATPHARCAVGFYTHLNKSDLERALVTLRECEEAEAVLAPEPPCP